MSSSQGNPSNKDKWYKSMCAKINHENQIDEEAKRVAKSPGYKPRFKEGKKANKLFAESLEVQKRLEHKRSKNPHKKERNHE